MCAVVALPVLVHERGTPAPTPRPQKQNEAQADPAADRGITAAQASREARRTGKDVEVTADRTAHSTVWAQPDGMMRIRTHSDTIRAKSGGEWKKIDTTLRRVEGGYAPTAVNTPSLFSAGSAAREAGAPERVSRALPRGPLPASAAAAAEDGTWSELVRLTSGNHDVVVSWPGPLPAPVVDGPRALYRNVRPDIDLLMTARDGGYSHVLIVHTRQAAADPLLGQLNYRLSSPTLDFRLDATTHAVTAVDSAGTEIAVAPTPYLWDSAGEPATTQGESGATAGSSPDPSLTLPGLAGPQPGSHGTPLGATLTDGVLDLAVNTRVLNDADTVYPVFIDPSFKVHRNGWALLYQSAPSSSFWNGQNFNDGTNEARVGYEATTNGLSRSVFNFPQDKALHGAAVRSSTFKVWQTYSWGCTARQYNVHLTSGATPSHTWNSQPAWGRVIDSVSNGYGYRADTCPDQWAGVDIKSVAQEAATGRWSLIAIGLRAANEADTGAWKKFMANGEFSPYIETVYNHPPNEPLQVGMSTVPGGTCDLTNPYVTIGKSDITFRVTGVDIDRDDLRYVHLKVWPNDNPGAPVIDYDFTPYDDGTIAYRIDWEKFASKTYSWTAWTVDHSGARSAAGPSRTTAYCQFTVDQKAPGSPTVTSAQFPPPGRDLDQWSTVEFGTAGTFTFSTAMTVAGVTKVDTSVSRYEYSLNIANHTANPYLPTSSGAAVSKSLRPTAAGPNILYVWAVDIAGNRSPSPTKYVFYVKPRKNPDPAGDLTGDGTPDLLAIDGEGNLLTYTSEPEGDIAISLPSGLDGAGQVLDDGHWKNSAGAPALITHRGDWYPGDGVNDMLARMPDGKLYAYPGDGYGSFNTAERVDVLMPPGSPSTASLTQIAAVGDITGDGLPDVFARAGGQLWAFTGYTGASFAQARLLAGSSWDTRDIVTAGDITGDGVADLLFRTEEDGRGLLLRHGKAAAGGGVDLASLAAAASSGTGKDEVYGTGGWDRAGMPKIVGIPDSNGDKIPDLWAVSSNGNISFYPGTATGHGSPTVVGAGGWDNLLALG